MVITAKWLEGRIPPGIPCIVTLNDEDVFYKMQRNKMFESVCYFCDLGIASLLPLHVT